MLGLRCEHAIDARCPGFEPIRQIAANGVGQRDFGAAFKRLEPDTQRSLHRHRLQRPHCAYEPQHFIRLCIHDAQVHHAATAGECFAETAASCSIQLQVGSTARERVVIAPPR